MFFFFLYSRSYIILQLVPTLIQRVSTLTAPILSHPFLAMTWPLLEVMPAPARREVKGASHDRDGGFVFGREQLQADLWQLMLADR